MALGSHRTPKATIAAILATGHMAQMFYVQKKKKKSCKCRNPGAEGTSIAMFLSHCSVTMTSSPDQAKCDMVSCLLVFVHTAPSAQNILFYPTFTTQYPAFPPPHHLFLWSTPTASSLGVITLEKLSWPLPPWPGPFLNSPIYSLYHVARGTLEGDWVQILGPSPTSFEPKSSSVQSLSCAWLFATHGLQHARLPYPSPTPGDHQHPSPTPIKLMSIELVMPSNHLILCHSLLLIVHNPSVSPVVYYLI